MVRIEDIRQQRLKELLTDRKLTKAALAALVGVQPSYISRVLSTGKNRKRVQETLARKMEQSAGLPFMSLDKFEGPLPPPPSWPFSFPRARYDRLDPRDREKIDEAIKIMMSLCEGNRLDRAAKKRAA